jgi:hypothetical protein
MISLDKSSKHVIDDCEELEKISNFVRKKNQDFN